MSSDPPTEFAEMLLAVEPRLGRNICAELDLRERSSGKPYSGRRDAGDCGDSISLADLWAEEAMVSPGGYVRALEA